MALKHEKINIYYNYGGTICLQIFGNFVYYGMHNHDLDGKFEGKFIMFDP